VETSSLKKSLGLLDVFCVASGAMISSGLFVLPGIAYDHAGAGVFLCYLVASLLLAPSLLTHAELVTAAPKAGGAFLLIDRSVGPAFGMMGGLAAWAALCFKTAFALIGIGAFARMFWPQMSWVESQAVAVGFCLFFMWLNLLGAKHATGSQVFLVAGLLALLVAYVALGAGKMEAARFRPFFADGKGVGVLFMVSALVFVSYGGLAQVDGVAEEVRRPGRAIPLGMFLAYGLVSLLYVAVVAVTVGVAGGPALRGNLTPLSLGGDVILGRTGWAAMAVAAILAFLSTANAGILSASRTLMAMGRDHLLPDFLARTHPRRGTPGAAVKATSLCVIAALFMDLELFVKTASCMIVLVYVFVVVAVILMRESRVASYAPEFRCPFYPWTQVAALGVNALLLVELGTGPLLVAGAILGGGMAWYGLYAKSRVSRQSALALWARRVASQTFADHDLEAELAQIVHERDMACRRPEGAWRQEDWFDGLVKQCPVLDVAGRASRDQLFGLIAQAAAPRLRLTVADITRMLKEREALSSTVVKPGVAAPHILAPGEGVFEIVLARCAEGVEFAPGGEPVRAVFSLFGSGDQRELHLRALMAVAEIVQDVEFDHKWRKPHDVAGLRRMVLQAHRTRDAAVGPAPRGEAGQPQSDAKDDRD